MYSKFQKRVGIVEHIHHTMHHARHLRTIGTLLALISAVILGLTGQTNLAKAAPAAQADTTSPVANPTYSPDPGPDGWSNVDITITWNWTDEGSGVDPTCPTQTVVTNGNPFGTLCLDLAGNVGQSGNSGALVDKKAPNTQITIYPESTITTSTAIFSFKEAAPSDPPLLPVGDIETGFLELNASPFAGHV